MTFSEQSAAGDSSQTSDELQLRVLSDGMLTVLDYADKSTFIEGDAHALRLLLEAYFPLSSSFSDPFKPAVDSRGKSRFFRSLGRKKGSQTQAIGSHIGCFKAGDYAGTR